MKAAAEQTADRSAAEVVEEKITAIGEVEFTDASKTKIKEAKEAYNGLTDAQKILVTNYEKLTMAEMRYLELKAEVDQSSADVVIALINAIGEVTFTDESKAIIDGAKEAYENLTTEQKALVSNYDTLTTAETKYSELKRNAES